MSLSLQDVKRVAMLARIAVSDSEAASYQQQLNGIFSLIEQMQAVDTSGVEPMSHAQDVCQRLRADLVTETDQREKFQAIAPQVEAGLYLVPQVIES
jgi:aspartyl-tRNA(Asn)/glutamyl-tRNA(Gln) amidotransferase subunit C